MRRFDLKDELRATADRRKRPLAPQPSGSSGSSGWGWLRRGGGGDDGAAQADGSYRPDDLRGQGVAGIAARLAGMFPTLPQDTVQAVLSEMFRADSSVSREELADRAVGVLLDMCLDDGEAHALTSFEPRCSGDAASLQVPGACGAAPSKSSSANPDPSGRVTPGALPEQALWGLEDDRDAVVVVDDDDSAAGAPRREVGEGSDEAAWDTELDEELAQLLTLSDQDLAPCVRTMLGILDRIAADPSNMKFRRLRLANAKFAAAVGRHEQARALLRLAGFVDDAGEGEGDAGIACFEDPASSPGFSRVHEALRGVLEVYPEMAAAPDVPAVRPAPSAAARRGSANDNRHRARIAELTERRLRDPRGFRAEAMARGAANRAVGGRLYAPSQAASAGAPHRRAQHFTLSDIDRMRVEGEIAAMPSYAEEYRRGAHSAPVHDYGALVARSYDPELIARSALDSTNRYRASNGLAPLRWHDGIARIAAEHAAQMASGAMPFSHDGFDARVRAFPVAHRGAGENLALNKGVADVAAAAVDGWIKSPGHEKNLRGAWNMCGIGVARSSGGTFYLTQLFASAY